VTSIPPPRRNGASFVSLAAIRVRMAVRHGFWRVYSSRGRAQRRVDGSGGVQACRRRRDAAGEPGSHARRRARGRSPPDAPRGIRDSTAACFSKRGSCHDQCSRTGDRRHASRPNTLGQEEIVQAYARHLIRFSAPARYKWSCPPADAKLESERDAYQRNGPLAQPDGQQVLRGPGPAKRCDWASLA
jgi:hypothetical protein